MLKDLNSISKGIKKLPNRQVKVEENYLSRSVEQNGLLLRRKIAKIVNRNQLEDMK